jgi:hypothetical protein
MSKEPDKGGNAEELLRAYFHALGYYVARGVKFTYKGNSVSDIDLWLYLKSSSLNRERAIVDIKNKKVPQAMERILWTRGLLGMLNLDTCIVATTDKRPVVREFGKIHNVNVLDGNFFSKLKEVHMLASTRYTEEEFINEIKRDDSTIFKGDWCKILEDSKSRLLFELDYSGCNLWLNDIKYFLEQAQIDPARREFACRLGYLIFSHFLIGLDFAMKDLAFLDDEARGKVILEGFKHGSSGRDGIKNVLHSTYTLIERFLPNGRDLSSQLKRSLHETMDQVPVEILKEYFSKSNVIKALFSNARKFEELAYKREFTNPNHLETELAAIVSIVLDFSEINRKGFFEKFPQKQEKSEPALKGDITLNHPQFPH